MSGFFNSFLSNINSSPVLTVEEAPISKKPSLTPAEKIPSSKKPSLTPVEKIPSSKKPSLTPTEKIPSSRKPSLAPTEKIPSSRKPSLAPTEKIPSSSVEKNSMKLFTAVKDEDNLTGKKLSVLLKNLGVDVENEKL